MQSFPTIEKVYGFFVPAKWAYCISHVEECLSYPCVTLRQLDGLYGTDGAAQAIVKAQMIGVYRLCTAREQYNDDAAGMAAGLFVSKYGHECTLYAMMLYFGNYLTEYKSSYAQYDVQDILQQFGKKFLPWWRAKRGRRSASEPSGVSVSQRGVPTGDEALHIHLRRCVREGRDIRLGGLYRLGIVSDADIERAEREVREGVI